MTIYVHDADGRITHSVNTSDPEAYRAMLVEQGQAFVEREGDDLNPSTHYVADGEVVPRGVMALTFPATVPADGETVAAISGVPAGATITVDGVGKGEADGTDIENTFDVAGSYWFRFEHPAFLTAVITITAEPVP